MPRVPGFAGILFAWLVLAGCGAGQEGESVTASSDGGETAGPVPEVGREADGARPEPGRAWVIFGTDTVVAEVARTPEERAEGLMYREAVPDGTGMLFVYPDMAVRSFWMQNTYVPLDIAYMDAGLAVVDIQQMEPETTRTYESAAPAMFALEVRQGWFAEKGIEVGHTAQVEFGPLPGG
jgi:hypothetical protein